MMERCIKPSELVVGMRFRLTGEAEGRDEREDTSVYEVIERDPGPKLFAKLTVRAVGSDETRPAVIAPWVPLILVETEPVKEA